LHFNFSPPQCFRPASVSFSQMLVDALLYTVLTLNLKLSI